MASYRWFDDAMDQLRDQLNLVGYAPRVDRSAMPVFVYGNSYAANPGIQCTAGLEYFHQAAGLLTAGTVTSYGLSSTRIFDTASALISASSGLLSGLSGQQAGAQWPGTSARRGLIVLDDEFNDVGHYPDMTIGLVHPVAITGANTQYKDAVTDCYRTALALLSCESRIEQESATFAGTWASEAFPAAASGGDFAYTTTPGASVAWSITPPQSGPMAGRVYVLGYKLTAAGFTMATVNVQLDGGAAVGHTPTGVEEYKGANGQQVNNLPWVIPVQLPVDGNAHTVMLTHAGTAGEFMYADAVLICSTAPNPVAVMQASTPPRVISGVWAAGDVAIWEQNLALLDPAIQAVVAEFPNALWVPSTVSQNGISSIDGIHPNDRGMAQRANDLAQAAAVWAACRACSLELAPDAQFAKL